MSAEVGQFALILALLLALVQSVAPLVGSGGRTCRTVPSPGGWVVATGGGGVRAGLGARAGTGSTTVESPTARGASNSPVFCTFGSVVARLGAGPTSSSGRGESGLVSARWARMRTHRIMTEMLAGFGASSKLNAEWSFVSMLRDEGRRTAGEFLDRHAADLGVRSTMDLDLLVKEC